MAVDSASGSVPDSSSTGELRKLLTSLPKKSESSDKDHVLIITELSKIDYALNELLLRVLCLDESAGRDNLIAEGEPLGSLVLRARLAKRMGIISNDLYAVIKILADIRNRCAHTTATFAVFDDDSIKDKTLNLFSRLAPDAQSVWGKPETLSIRDKFKCVANSCEVYLDVIRKDQDPTPSAEKEFILR